MNEEDLSDCNETKEDGIKVCTPVEAASLDVLEKTDSGSTSKELNDYSTVVVCEDPKASFGSGSVSGLDTLLSQVSMYIYTHCSSTTSP